MRGARPQTNGHCPFVDERKCVSAQTGPCPFASATQMGTARLILGNDDVATRNYEAKMSTHSRSPASARLILRSPQVLSPWAAFSRRVGSKREVRLRKNCRHETCTQHKRELPVCVRAECPFAPRERGVQTGTEDALKTNGMSRLHPVCRVPVCARLGANGKCPFANGHK